ncbi:MAG: hypothetical protein SO360_06485 [Bifidobacterium tsurumiense]|uniref:hypothetical protein n=1 Tax=Bifidobacterium tsurumiense TaxID=356829 RepID=UPI002A7FD2EB|nr:hypothetical protein [Bifidobacterium tsurumiense]MDY4678487.1 hypothetical protein [Bifidobacterium tsurumiense]
MAAIFLALISLSRLGRRFVAHMAIPVFRHSGIQAILFAVILALQHCSIAALQIPGFPFFRLAGIAILSAQALYIRIPQPVRETSV